MMVFSYHARDYIPVELAIESELTEKRISTEELLSVLIACLVDSNILSPAQVLTLLGPMYRIPL